jgi:hypothetical protein
MERVAGYAVRGAICEKIIRGGDDNIEKRADARTPPPPPPSVTHSVMRRVTPSVDAR